LPTRTVEELAADPNLEGGIKWLIDDLIPMEALTVVCGIGKAGKTTLLTRIAAAVIGDDTFIERSVVGGPVLWIDLEQQISLTLDGLTSAGAINGKHQVHVYAGATASVSKIKASVLETGAKLVVIDSLSKLFLFRDENDASEVTKALVPLIDLCRTTGAAVVAIHHERKREGSNGKSIRGSGAILAALDVAIMVRPEGGEKENRRSLEFISRYPAIHGRSLSVRLTDNGYEALGDRQSVRQDEILKAIAESVLTAEEIGGLLGVTRQALLPSLTRAVTAGSLTRTGTGRKGSPHRFQQAARGSASQDLAALPKAS
jgi:molybdopterin-guanine dinucleotide biosynthesis protein